MFKINLPKSIGELEFWKKMSGFLPRHSLITLYKSFIQLHLDYADIMYNQPNNLNPCNKIETWQYNAALAITGAIRSSLKEKQYQKLDFEYLSSQRWLKKLCTFYRIVRNKSCDYLYKYILPGNHVYLTRNSNNRVKPTRSLVSSFIPYMSANFFWSTKYSFFHYTSKEWNKLSLETRNFEPFSIFKNLCSTL